MTDAGDPYTRRARTAHRSACNSPTPRPRPDSCRFGGGFRGDHLDHNVGCDRRLRHVVVDSLQLLEQEHRPGRAGTILDLFGGDGTAGLQPCAGQVDRRWPPDLLGGPALAFRRRTWPPDRRRCLRRCGPGRAHGPAFRRLQMVDPRLCLCRRCPRSERQLPCPRETAHRHGHHLHSHHDGLRRAAAVHRIRHHLG